MPAGCTGELQPLDTTANCAFRKQLKSCFSSWYVKQVAEALGSGKDIESIKVNLAVSVIKALYAKWLIHVITAIAAQEDTIINGFDKAGITSSSIFFH